MTKLDLLKEINSVYDHIKTVSIDSEVGQLLDELNTCNAYLARSAQLQADAEEFLNIAKGEASHKYAETLKTMKEKFNATQSRSFIDSKITAEEKIFTLAERLNKTLQIRIDSIRTAISFEKSQIERNHSEPGRREPQF
jgi:hypothetical protein